MVITWLMMVMVLLTDHGQPWLTMVNISDLTTIDHHMTMTIDHGRPWSDHDPAARVVQVRIKKVIIAP